MSDSTIRALPLWSGPIDIEPLGGGLTNRNYRVDDRGRRFAVREGVDQPRLGICRRNERTIAAIAAELGVGPRVVHAEPGLLVTDFVAGEPLDARNVERPGCLQRVARALRRVHDAGPSVAAHLRWFSPFQAVLAYLRTADAERLSVPGGDAQRIADDVAALQARVPPFRPTLCHNDLMPGNALDDGTRVMLIDWEYAGFGDPHFDLAGLLSNCDFDRERSACWLAAYRDAGDTPARIDDGAVAVLVAMAALRESLWAVVQGSESDLAFDYAAYREANWDKYRRALARLGGA